MAKIVFYCTDCGNTSEIEDLTEHTTKISKTLSLLCPACKGYKFEIIKMV